MAALSLRPDPELLRAALNKFRSAGISHGVYARSVMGTAASSIVRRAGSTIHGSIVLGLEFARGTYTSPLGQPKAKAAL